MSRLWRWFNCGGIDCHREYSHFIHLLSPIPQARMNSSNVVTPHNNTCSRLLSQQLRLCPVFLGKQEFREERLRRQNRGVTAAEVQTNPPAAAGGLEPPLCSRAHDCLGFVPGSLGFSVKGLKTSWGEKMFSLLFAAFYRCVFAASHGPRSPSEQELAERGHGGCSSPGENRAEEMKNKLERRFR